MSRILWIAVADARGHLMRAHRARRLLAPSVEVDVVTTSDAGVAFLAALGTPARVLGRGYALAFDAQQHLERGRTQARLLRYLARDALGDVRRLRRWAEHYDLIVDDALHPATLIASLLFDPEVVPIVHVFGTTLREAVVEIGSGRRERHRSPARKTEARAASSRVPNARVGSVANAVPGSSGAPGADVGRIDAEAAAPPASFGAPSAAIDADTSAAATSSRAPCPSDGATVAASSRGGASAGAIAVPASSAGTSSAVGFVAPGASAAPASSRAPMPSHAHQFSARSHHGTRRLGDGAPMGLFARLLERALRRAFARIEYAVDADPEGTRLRPLVDPPRRSREAVRRALGVGPDERLVVAYLNPHFTDPGLAAALESAPGRLYAVGEGFAGRPGWVAYDGDLADKLAAADVVVSAPGVATLTAVKASGVPYVALRSRQPEQRENLTRLGRDFEVVDVAAPDALPAAIERARRAPPGEPTATIAGDWRRTLNLLIDERNYRCLRALHWSSRPTT
ncbi:MAG: hypothetical protein RIT81_23405 [Deltaproteobacteria bacterium]